MGECNFTKSSTPPWVFSSFFKLYKWYQIAQSITTNYSWINKLNDNSSKEFFLKRIKEYVSVFSVGQSMSID